MNVIVSKFSELVTELLQDKSKLFFDHYKEFSNLFKIISFDTKVPKQHLEEQIKLFDQHNKGKCTFWMYRENKNDENVLLFLSELSEKEIIRITKFKAFW